MKLKKEFYNETLSEIGFEFRVEDPEPENRFDEIDFELVDRYVYEIGHSRRGQVYYLTIHPETLEIYVYADRADGRGTHIQIGYILFEMIGKGMVEIGEGT